MAALRRLGPFEIGIHSYACLVPLASISFAVGTLVASCFLILVSFRHGTISGFLKQQQLNRRRQPFYITHNGNGLPRLLVMLGLYHKRKPILVGALVLKWRNLKV